MIGSLMHVSSRKYVQSRARKATRTCTWWGAATVRVGAEQSHSKPSPCPTTTVTPRHVRRAAWDVPRALRRAVAPPATGMALALNRSAAAVSLGNRGGFLFNALVARVLDLGSISFHLSHTASGFRLHVAQHLLLHLVLK